MSASVNMTGCVLLVDDNEDLRTSLQFWLESKGFVVFAAVDGNHALEALARGLRPCVVLLDWQLPGIMGHELLAALRRQPHFADAPIYILTATPWLVDSRDVPVIEKPNLNRIYDVVTHHCNPQVGVTG